MKRRNNTSLKMTNENVIKLVSKARKERGYSQREFCRMLDKNESWCFLVEKDRASIPLNMVRKVCFYLLITHHAYLKAWLADREIDFKRGINECN